jgi:hypothetical protein
VEDKWLLIVHSLGLYIVALPPFPQDSVGLTAEEISPYPDEQRDPVSRARLGRLSENRAADD